METRDLFERLVTDEPPLGFSTSDAVRTGQRAATRRWSVAGAIAATVVVVGGGLVARVATDQPGATAPGSSAGVKTSTDDSLLPFISVAQVETAGQALLITLQSTLPYEQGWSAKVGSRSAFEIDRATAGPPDRVLGQVHRDSATSTLIVQLTATSAVRARKDYGEAVTKGPCVAPIPDRGAAIDCRRSALPDGRTLWTWQVAAEATDATATPAAGQRSALLVAADGNVLEALEFAEQPGGGADMALPSTGALDYAALSQLAQTAAQAWAAGRPGHSPLTLLPSSGPSRQPGPSASAQPSTRAQPSTQPGTVASSGAQTTGEAMPSLGGPGITSLAFSKPGQIAASNAAVYAKLVAAAGGKAALLKGWPTWDSDPVSASTKFLGTQVQWAAGKDSAYLQVVTSTKADAADRYGAILASGPCAVAANQGQGAPEHCLEVPLPGGAKGWSWDDTGALPGADGGTSSSSPHGVIGRNVLVIAKDGSTLALTEFAQQGQAVGGGTPTSVPDQPDNAALFTLATEAAQAWATAAG